MKLFFAVGAREYVYLLLICGVKNILASFAYPEAFQCRRVLRKHGVKLMADSGAFTAWTKGKEVNLDDYFDFLEANKDIIDQRYVVNLDVIRGGRTDKPTQEDYNEAARLGFENLYKMRKKGYDAIHTFHQGENFVWLERMIKECNYIGISANNDFVDSVKDKWLYECYYTIKRSKKPDIKTHGFGVTSPELLAKYPYTSVDSAAWALSSAFGTVLTPYGRIIISEGKNAEEKAKRFVDPRFIENLPEHQRKKIIDYIRSFGFSYKLTKKNYKYRNLINIDYYQTMEKKLNEQPTIFSDHQKPLFNFLEWDRKRNKKLIEKFRPDETPRAYR